MAVIKQLDPHVADLIAAGEVVERPEEPIICIHMHLTGSLIPFRSSLVLLRPSAYFLSI